MTRITFFGAADTVTGSRHLIDTGGVRVLLDCGMFQGYKVHRERNWEPVPPELRRLDAVIVSHAHLDHSGWLPVLVREGYQGPIWCTPATAELLKVMLLDSAHLQEQEARRANRGGYSRHEVARPLYTTREAQRALALLRTLPFGRSQGLGGNARFELLAAGHLLGAAMVRLHAGSQTIVFSGDLGRPHDLLMPAPQRVPQADVLLMESTYGNRIHAPDDLASDLARVVRETAARGGSVLMPTFAVGRAQALMVQIHRLKRDGLIPDLPVYLDSPMALQASQAYLKYAKLLAVPQRELREALADVRAVASAQQSARLVSQRMPRIVLAASGMATGGRVLFHLQTMAPDPRHHIVFPGYQVGGTRGARMVAGEREVKMFGQLVPVRAQVSQFEGFSGHADSDELLSWLGGFDHAPAQTFLVHGEPFAADTLRSRIRNQLDWAVRVATHGQTVQV